MVKIYSKCLVKYCARNLARTQIKTHKGDEKRPLFVNKQLFWWSASITLGNNNDVLTDWISLGYLVTNMVVKFDTALEKKTCTADRTLTS